MTAVLWCAFLVAVVILVGVLFAVTGGIALKAVRPAVQDQTDDDLMSVLEAVERGEPVRERWGDTHVTCFKACVDGRTNDICRHCKVKLGVTR